LPFEDPRRELFMLVVFLKFYYAFELALLILFIANPNLDPLF